MALLGVAVCACTTLGRHQELEQRVVLLEKFREETRQTLQRDVSRLENLNQRIKTAADELRKYGAGLAARVGGVEDEARQLLGRIEEVQHLAGKQAEDLKGIKRFLDTQFGFTLIKFPKDTPRDPDKLFAFAETKFEAKKYPLARALLQHFTKTHRSHGSVRAAKLLIGETYRLQRRYNDALKVYAKMFARWQDNPRQAPPEVPKALWLAGKTLEDQGECGKAVEMYKLLARMFKKSPEGAKAKVRAKSLRCG